MPRLIRFTVYRGSWDKGRGSATRLYSPDKKLMDVFGQFAKQRAVPLSELGGLCSLRQLTRKFTPRNAALKRFITQQVGFRQTAPDAQRIMRYNDSEEITREGVREEVIKSFFADFHVQVEFVDGIAPWFRKGYHGGSRSRA